jgi:diguanylate cyclase (GGDEF)-like protein
MIIVDHAVRARDFVLRHRLTFQDLFLLLAVLGLGAYVLLEVDVFVVEGAASAERSIEFDEIPILGTVLGIGLVMFAWRRSNDRKRETETRRQLLTEQARRLALQDFLTGLPNRRQFNDAVKAAIGAPPRGGATHALLTLDLNGFKRINDSYGHGIGDEVLRVVASRIQKAVREGDLVARLGGDEFAVIAEQLAGGEAATSVALRILDSLAAPIAIGRVQHQIGAGIGICLFPFPDCTTDEAMRRADVALYRAKAERKSSLRFFDEDMDRHVREREHLEHEFRAALASQAIVPHFQALVDLRSNTVNGFEALARWTHPTLGSIPPARFIPLAEDLGLMGQLTDQLLRASCRAARDWPEHVILAFNISAVELSDRTLGQRVLAILEETGVSPRRIELEITESALVRHLEAVQEILGPLRNAGVRIVLDDFGTGYSSLYHLRNFKFDKIKIDHGFVENMAAQWGRAQIVNGLIGLGHGLGLTVSAEGIGEKGEILELLASGCEQGQGFFFGEAMPAAATRELFAAAAERAAAD